MPRRTGLAACAVVLGTTAVLTLFGAGSAVADSSRGSGYSGSSGGSNSRSSYSGGSDSRGYSGGSDSGYGGKSRGMSSDDGNSRRNDYTPDARQNVKQPQSSPTPPGGGMTNGASPPDWTPTGTVAAPEGPTVGGRPATTGAAGTEAASASTAPTPPNGAVPAAAGSPAAAVFSLQQLPCFRSLAPCRRSHLPHQLR